VPNSLVQIGKFLLTIWVGLLESYAPVTTHNYWSWSWHWVCSSTISEM